MKGYRRLWFMSFIVTLAILSVSIFLFMNYMKDNSAVDAPAKTENQTQVNTEFQYSEPQDNVGAVSFTEDQMTELARNLFSLDKFLNNISLKFDGGKIIISAAINDKDKLIEIYPELKKYSAILSSLEHENMKITAMIDNDDGRASLTIESVTVGDTQIDGDIIAPFIESDDFSSLFDVEFESVELCEGEVVFKNGVPDILKY